MTTATAATTLIKKDKKPKKDKTKKDKTKKDKKKRKRTEEDNTHAATTLDNDLLGEKKKLKKLKKLKKKLTTLAGEGTTAEAAPTTDNTSIKKTKKTSKKPKAEGTPAEAAPTTIKKKTSKNQTLPRTKPSQAQQPTSTTSVTVENAPPNTSPVLTFAGFPQPLLAATATFTTPSPIQSHCWPIIAAHRDLVGIAATGSGKTLAFGLPALQRLMSSSSAAAAPPTPSTLVLAPTRELACQTADVLKAAAQPIRARVVCLYGGVNRREQVQDVKRGIHVVVGTPGRIQDLMQECLDLSTVTYAVLDEADRMLDMGFEPHVRAILYATNPARQTLMFSATWPLEVRSLAGEFMRNPAKVTIGSEGLSASHTVQQIVEVVEHAAKEQRLVSLLHGPYKSSRKMIVFVLYKKEAARMESFLTRKGHRVAAVHGDLSQQARTEAVEAFKAGKAPLLLATDVAARGLDIPDVDVVINYSFPLTTEDYVHRYVYEGGGMYFFEEDYLARAYTYPSHNSIGRTGRAGKRGVAHTLFCGATDKARAGELINVLREANQPVPPELLKFGTTVKKKESKLYGAHFRDDLGDAKSTKVVFDDDSD